MFILLTILIRSEPELICSRTTIISRIHYEIIELQLVSLPRRWLKPIPVSKVSHFVVKDSTAGGEGLIPQGYCWNQVAAVVVGIHKEIHVDHN